MFRYLIFNKGIADATSADAVSLFPNAVLAMRPELAFLGFGMNDAIHEPRRVPLIAFRDNMSEVVKRCKNYDIASVLITINPVNENAFYAYNDKRAYEAEGGANARIRAYNTVLFSLANRYALPVIDFHRTVNERGGPLTLLANDGIHPKRRAITTLANEVATLTKARLPNGGTVVCFGDGATRRGYPEEAAILLNKESVLQ